MRHALILTALAVGFAAADEKAGPKEFEGTWTIVESEKVDPAKHKKDEPVVARTVVFSGNTYTIKYGDKTVEEGKFSVDATKSPPKIVVEAVRGEGTGTKWHGIYELKGDSLRAVVGKIDQAPPGDLDKPAEGTRTFTLRRTPSK